MSARLTRSIAASSLALALAVAAAADDHRLILAPEATEIGFRLPATLHTVEGRATLERGEIVFCPRSGVASGEIVIDARSLATGNRKRDRQMHREVLESDAFPAIVFVPERFEGSLEPDTDSPIRLHGELRIHGTVHPAVISAEARTEEGRLTATGRLTVPYVALGMKDPSRLLLRVAKEVEVEIAFTAELQAPAGG